MASNFDLGSTGNMYFIPKVGTPDNYQYMGTGHWLLTDNTGTATTPPMIYSTNGTDWFAHAGKSGALTLYNCDMYVDLDNGACTIQAIPINAFIGVDGGTHDLQNKDSKNY